MSKAIILQHVSHESPGRIVPVFRDFGIQTEVRHLYKGDEVPSDLDELRCLVVLGGAMGVSDIGDARYPFLQQEVELLQRMVKADRPTLGICLGAQLLAHAAGAKVYPNVKAAPPAPHGAPPPAPDAPPPPPPAPLPEFGWGPVTFPFPGGTDPIVFGAMDGAPMFHWHFDTFDLPRLPAPPNAPPPPAPPPPTGNALLSSSRLCKNQAYRFKNRLFGFQYHLEFTPAEIEGVVANASDKEKQALGEDGLARLRDETPKFYPRYERLGNRVLQNFVQFLKVYSSTGH
jgi:GMP synthase-like glutamine amidotransferase